MGDELIRKSDVIEIMENLIYDMSEVSTIPQLAKQSIENLPPVNAVELPCKVGDTVYSPTTTSVEAAIVDHIRLTQDGIYLNLREWHCLSNINRIGKSMFLTREEAEKALEDLKNENK